MSTAYANYLANTTFKTYSFGNVTGLGSSARTTGAVLLGGPRAGAGSAYRIYSYLRTTNPGLLNMYSSKIQTLLNKRSGYYSDYFDRNYYSLGYA
jgi:hypothetical protein